MYTNQAHRRTLVFTESVPLLLRCHLNVLYLANYNGNCSSRAGDVDVSLGDMIREASQAITASRAFSATAERSSSPRHSCVGTLADWPWLHTSVAPDLLCRQKHDDATDDIFFAIRSSLRRWWQLRFDRRSTRIRQQFYRATTFDDIITTVGLPCLGCCTAA